MDFNNITTKDSVRKSTNGPKWYVDRKDDTWMRIRNSRTGVTEIVVKDQYENKYQKFS